MQILQLFALILFISVYSVSCKKEKIFEAVAPQFRKLEKVTSMIGLKQMLNNASGSVGITNLKPFGPEQFLSGGGPSEVYADFFDSEGRVTFGALEVQGITITPSAFDYYKSDPSDRPTIQSYFGDVQPIRLYAFEEADEDLLFEQSIYLPKELFVYPPMQRGTYRITQTTTLRWNPDPQNVNGIFILIDFLPDGEENSGKYTTSFVSHRKLIYTEDDGAYQLQASDFNKIPSGAYVSFIVGRGDYVETIGSNDKSYILYSFTGAVADFFVDAEQQ